jgi:hypothetical protein
MKWDSPLGLYCALEFALSTWAVACGSLPPARLFVRGLFCALEFSLSTWAGACGSLPAAVPLGLLSVS